MALNGLRKRAAGNGNASLQLCWDLKPERGRQDMGTNQPRVEVLFGSEFVGKQLELRDGRALDDRLQMAQCRYAQEDGNIPCPRHIADQGCALQSKGTHIQSIGIDALHPQPLTYGALGKGPHDHMLVLQARARPLHHHFPDPVVLISTES